jgi:signal transduction histidine kinase
MPLTPVISAFENPGGDPVADRWITGALGILLQVNEAVTSADDVTRALNRLADLALHATGADRAAILTCGGPERMDLVPAAAASRFGDSEALRRRFLAMEPIHLDDYQDRLHLLWDAPRPSALHDVANSTLIPKVWRDRWRSRSLAFAPLIAAGERFGVIAVEYVRTRHVFTEGELDLLEAIAGSAGVAIRSAHLVEQLQRSISVERRLRECSAALQSGKSLAEVLDLVVDRFASLLFGTSCVIYTSGANQRTLQLVAYRGMTPRPEISLDDLPPDVLADIRRTWRIDPHQPIVARDASQMRAWREHLPPEIGTGMLVPLCEEQEVVGVVAIGRERQPFSNEEVDTAVALAGHAAIALSRARMTEFLQVRLKLIQALFSLSETVTRTSSLKAVLSRLNRDVCVDAGVTCRRLSLARHELARSLGASPADDKEIECVRGWRRRGANIAPIESGGLTGFPVFLGRRPAGILWVRFGSPSDRIATEFVKAIAAGLGEIASKANLRLIGERRARQLAIAAERERIARDLNDTVGQTLYGIGLGVQNALFDMGEVDPLREQLGDLRAMAVHGVADVRRAVFALSSVGVEEEGLVASLRGLVRQFQQSSGVRGELIVRGRLPILGKRAVDAIFRVAHEALGNIERHARATGVILTLAADDDGVRLSVRDDGVGIGNREGVDWRSSAHLGMRAMARAIHDVDGHFVVQEARPRGLLIEATVKAGVDWTNVQEDAALQVKPRQVATARPSS